MALLTDERGTPFMLKLAPALARVAWRFPGLGTFVGARSQHHDASARAFGGRGLPAESTHDSGLGFNDKIGKEPADVLPYPPEFDPDIYRRHPDLVSMNNDELRLHYQEYGLTEGRVASAACQREHFIALAASEKAILEIGPFCSPAIQGKRVKYFDVLDQENLRERAKEHQLDPAGCPHIDYVSPTGDLSVVDETFDIVISSHVIEHQIDLIKHLQQIQNILRPAGAYFLIIPDKRFCFDHFIPEAAIGDILAAHYESRTSHSLQSVIEHLVLTTHNESARHWSGDHGDRLSDHTRERIHAAVHYFQESAGSYIDIHAWQFTPSSFQSIIHDLHRLKYIELFPTRVYDTPRDRLEFTAILSRRDSNT
jgi:SAM-dependent methyltransferase